MSFHSKLSETVDRKEKADSDTIKQISCAPQPSAIQHRSFADINKTTWRKTQTCKPTTAQPASMRTLRKFTAVGTIYLMRIFLSPECMCTPAQTLLMDQIRKAHNTKSVFTTYIGSKSQTASPNNPWCPWEQVRWKSWKTLFKSLRLSAKSRQ